MARPRIFISHSARDDPRARGLLDRLEAELLQDGFEVLLDRKCLEVGDSWEHRIATWLDRCHAAIVLFTTKALASSYVKYEVSNLLHRWQRGQGVSGSFGLYPVLVEPLTEQQLRDFYQAINLWAVQRLGPDTDQELVERLREKLAPLKAQGGAVDASEQLEGHVARILERVKDDDYLTTDVAGKVGIDTSEWPAENVAPLLARALVSRTLPDAWQAIRLLQPRLLDPALVWNLFDLLMPSWVGPESARALDELTKQPPGTRRAVLNATAAPFTPQMYVRRAKAQGTDLAGTVIPVRTADLGKDIEAPLRARVREQLESALDVNDPLREFPTTVAAELTARSPDEPVIVAVKIPPESLPAFVAVARTNDFGRATFLALVGSAAPAGVGIDPLQPPLPDDLEQQVYNQHFQYRISLKKALPTYDPDR